MNCFYYQIAGLTIKIISSRLDGFRTLDAFAMDHPSEIIDLEIMTTPSVHVSIPEGKLLIDDQAKWVCIPGAYYNTSVYLPNETTGEVICRADANEDWSSAEITYVENEEIVEAIVAGFLLEIIFRNRLLFKQGIVIHASAISWEGQGIAFTAPSGTGKSTQARLWAEHMQARVLNDDRPAIRLIDQNPTIYGTPWSGSKTLYYNASAPLKAIVLLEQAPENEIINLSAAQAVSKIMPRCFLPYYDQVIMGMCLNTLGEMISGISVYHLKCRPDMGAVKLLHQCLANQYYI
ncbi:hypothetical protein [Dehalobacter sp.]|uniref:hypothetical protein n=1 Tax=Dehalobacter sp. TaxID=1962289 RepID=UPI00258A21D2|nr:hypothetical protein [Dehalobacter sp.]MCG1024357.1 hypothetical protein [Dehalobacter sp.]